MNRLISTLVVALTWIVVLSGCATPDKPVRPTLFDFGPGTMSAQPLPGLSRLAPLLLADIQTSDALDGTAVLYRLAYANPSQLHPYALARWSGPPAQLIGQRLREQLALQRTVLDMRAGAALVQQADLKPRVLRIDLEEFTHLFESPAVSWGQLRLRVTLLDHSPTGERVLAQRSVVVRQPAPTPDAAGGVRALAAATDLAAQEIGQWLQQTP